MKWRIAVAVVVGILVLLSGAVAYVYRGFTHRDEGTYFDSNGTQIHYTDEGEGDLVVLVHGFAAHADLNWRAPGITEALAEEFRVVSMDQRGHGLSGKPHGPNQYGAEMAEDIVRLLDHLKAEKAHVVGYSLGGFVALKLATMHPKRLWTVSPLGAGWETGENSGFLSALAGLAEDLEAGRAIRPVSEALGDDRLKPGMLHVFWVKVLTKWFNDPQALVGVLRGIPDLGVTEEELRALPMPVCSIVGDDDGLMASVENMRGLVPIHSITIIEGADHIRTPTRAEFLNALLNFLREHQAEKSITWPESA